MKTALQKWASSPRERWYHSEWRSVVFGWLMGAVLVGWGTEGFLQSPSSEAPLDLLKLCGGLVLLLLTALWVRRPLKTRGEDAATED